jgi:imidazolonepropionase-like amidohydrolase
MKLVKALHDAGARLLLGTDFPPAFTVPGFSLHEELQNFVAAGLTPYQALRAGSSDAAEFLKKQDEFGTVTVGKRADLILLEANPLVDVRNAARRVGVMVHGRWLTEAELVERLEKLALSYNKN